MAKQIIDLGTTANDGTGTPLRDGGTFINDNFTELYNTAGWGFYVHDQLTPSTQVVTTTATPLIIDGGGLTSNTAYLPYEIRGTGQLWDTVNNKITPIGVGDGYSMRMDLQVTAKSGSPTELILDLDIGGGATPTIIIVEKIIGTGKTPPYTVSVGFPIFTLGTFNTNGGQLFLSTDAGSVTLTNRSLSIHRISNGQI